MTVIASVGTPLGSIGFERCVLTRPAADGDKVTTTVGLPDIAGVDGVGAEQTSTLPDAIALSGLSASCRGVNNTTSRTTFLLSVHVLDGRGSVCLNDSARQEPAPGIRGDVTGSRREQRCAWADGFTVRRSPPSSPVRDQRAAA